MPDLGGGESSTGSDQLPPPVIDDFEMDSLADWYHVDPQAAEVYIADGALVIEPHAFTVWHQATSAELVYWWGDGDFSITTTVDVEGMAGEPPESPYRLAGIMIRDPSGPFEDYVSVVIGAGATDPTVEVKSTDNSESTYYGSPWNKSSADLRICRAGDDVRVLIRIPPATWSSIGNLTRGDLPDQLEVGMMAYANAPTSGLTARFEEFVLQPINDATNCFED